MSSRGLLLQPRRVDAGGLGALDAMIAEAEAELIVEPAVRHVEREFMVIAMGIGQEARRLHRQAGDRIALGHIAREADGISTRIGCRRAKRIDITVAERIGDGRLRVCRSDERVMKQNQPHIRGDCLLRRQLAQDIVILEHRIGDGLDRAVAARIRLEIDRAVLGKIDFPGLAMRPQKFPGVIAPRIGDCVEPKRAELRHRIGDACFRQIPGVGVDGAIAHVGFPPSNQPSFR